MSPSLHKDSSSVTGSGIAALSVLRVPGRSRERSHGEEERKERQSALAERYHCCKPVLSLNCVALKR